LLSVAEVTGVPTEFGVASINWKVTVPSFTAEVDATAADSVTLGSLWVALWGDTVVVVAAGVVDAFTVRVPVLLLGSKFVPPE
jgi:hypothetical protein